MSLSAIWAIYIHRHQVYITSISYTANHTACRKEILSLGRLERERVFNWRNISYFLLKLFYERRF